MQRKLISSLSIAAAIFLLSACGTDKLTDAMYDDAVKDAAAGNRSNRELTRQEQFTYYEMEAKYRYEGAEDSGIGEKELPALLSLESAEGNTISYWVYPEQEMTDIQLLAKAEKQFGGMPEEMYRPKEGQISYEETDGLFRELLRTYHISEADVGKIYPFYWSASGQGLTVQEDFWAARISLTAGMDYEIRINANDGTLLDWTARPEGWFDKDREPGAFIGVQGQYTEEQVVEAAKSYMESIGYANASIESQAAYTVEKATPQDPVRQRVQVVLETGDTCRILISLEDLSVCGFINTQ